MLLSEFDAKKMPRRRESDPGLNPDPAFRLGQNPLFRVAFFPYLQEFG